ncbi:MAG: FtsX-like permease family protein [Pseudomonadota bacterium]
MNIVKLSIAGLRYRAVNNLLNIVVLALGIATIVTFLHINRQLEDRFAKDLNGIDLVVGAKGSPIQLILANIFHVDNSTGNIPFAEAENLKENHLIKTAIPLSLGDNYKGFRIVGTTPDYFSLYLASLAQGEYWHTEMQVVLGSDVASKNNLKIGDKIVGSHGLTAGGEEHADFPYAVVGILKPTGSVIDRLILTDTASIWHIHEHHDHDEKPTKKSKGKAKDADDDESHQKEITALLISYKSPLAAATLPGIINKTSSLQAASPAFELARLNKIIGLGGNIVDIFAGILIAIAAFGFFVNLFNAVSERSYDIALLRSLGATGQKIFAFIICEGLALSLAGTLLGIILGHVFAYILQIMIEAQKNISLETLGFEYYEFLIILASIAASVIVASIPAFWAYRTNVARNFKNPV